MATQKFIVVRALPLGKLPVLCRKVLVPLSADACVDLFKGTIGRKRKP